MKDIYLLKTDKKSRLCVTTEPVGEYDPLNPQFNSHKVKWLLYDKPRGSNKRIFAINIYITNDEEPTKGDWVYSLRGFVGKFGEFENSYFKECKKIVLTTDQDLIADKIQSIDEGFLEWFVKNSSQKEIKNNKVEITSYQFPLSTSEKYNTIVPKQDYKGVHLAHCYQGEYENGCKYGEEDCPAKPLKNYSKETIEEAAEKYARKQCGDMYDIEGLTDAKWGWETALDFKEGAKSDAAKEYWFEIFKIKYL